MKIGNKIQQLIKSIKTTFYSYIGWHLKRSETDDYKIYKKHMKKYWNTKGAMVKGIK